MSKPGRMPPESCGSLRVLPLSPPNSSFTPPTHRSETSTLSPLLFFGERRRNEVRPASLRSSYLDSVKLRRRPLRALGDLRIGTDAWLAHVELGRRNEAVPAFQLVR